MHFKHWQKYLTALTERQMLEVYLRETVPQPSNWALNTRCLYPGLSCMKEYIIKGRWTYLISRHTDRSHKIVYSQVGGTSLFTPNQVRHTAATTSDNSPLLLSPTQWQITPLIWKNKYSQCTARSQAAIRHHRTSPCPHRMWNTALTQSLPINLHFPGPLSLSHFVWLGDLIKKKAMCRYGNLQWT